MDNQARDAVMAQFGYTQDQSGCTWRWTKRLGSSGFGQMFAYLFVMDAQGGWGVQLIDQRGEVDFRAYPDLLTAVVATEVIYGDQDERNGRH